ncbi:dTMP kinase [Effusibacillus lacus]|uniref:Thymidylate kinase n=1 Tax=Effusibacillus lacus TaxID=1348429 RepID=A0A292YFD9_9BACL|nr:dTMP kinase [Effusibacillus lacus]TCS74430.1 dTMP kinase [Effusibacillus lacus]GAX88697.1 dTMP kinase [Effusibacillus lacus]
MSGLFITFEGPDGAGKSTQLQLLADHLGSLGIEYITTREPGGTPLADKIRALLLDPDNKSMAPKTEALLYAASRAQHVEEVIRPALLEEKVVLCDRYIDASIAYQAVGLGLSPEMIRRWNEEATEGLWPHRTFLIDIDTEQGLSRIEEKRGLDRIEGREVSYHKRVRETFLALAAKEPNRFVILDGTKSIQEIADRVRHEMDKLLNP